MIDAGFNPHRWAEGIDVSHWKPVKDWDALSKVGLSFFGVKATEGNYNVDPALEDHRKGVRVAGCFDLTIYYHFARTGNPMKQAKRFMDTVGPLRDNERLALDVETVPEYSPGQSRLDAISWINLFLSELMSVYTDRRPILYTSKRMWRQFGNVPFTFIDQTDLWVPRYNDSMVEPSLPEPWSAWKFWQWTDGEWPERIVPGVGR